MRLVLGLLLLFIPVCCYSDSLKDGRLILISQAELVKHIQQTPLSSPEHITLLSRAYTSQLQLSAYEQYTLIWLKHPNDAYANFLRGVAAQDYWFWASRPETSNSKVSLSELNRYQAIVKSCLSKSVELDPNNARAKMYYGYFLWQYDNHIAEGLTVMKQAVKQNPALPTLHTMMAEIYLNPSTKSYDLESAEKEIKMAINLDPGYASPHLSMVRLYVGKKQPDLAQKELREYLSLAPAETAQASWIKRYQTMIDYCKK